MTKRSIVHSCQTCWSEVFLLQPAGCCTLIHTSDWRINQSHAFKQIIEAFKAPSFKAFFLNMHHGRVPKWNLSVLVKLFPPPFSIEMQACLSPKSFCGPVFLLWNMLLELDPFWCRSSLLTLVHNYTQSRTLTFKSMQNCTAGARPRTENARGCDECS